MLFRRIHFDDLTHLFNLNALKAHIPQITPTNNAYGLYIDLDDFKAVNDQYGHHIGDAVLKRVGALLMQLSGQHTKFYRLGGDEFFALLLHRNLNDIKTLSNTIASGLSNITLEGYDIKLSASIGALKIDGSKQTVEDILKQSDQAMYKAKDQTLKNLVVAKP